jgi:hypothetical protein
MRSNQERGSWARSRAGRVVLGAITVPTALAVLTGCGSINGHGKITGAAGPADAGTTPTSATSAASPSTATDGDPSSGTASPSGTSTQAPATPAPAKSCGPGGGAVPAGAGTARTADLDGDGKRDTIWLADKGGERYLGVRTASGAVFSTTFSSASPISASAVASRLGNGAVVILLSTGRSVALYGVIDCQLVATKNTQGRQYTFDLNFTGYGTGAGCPVIGSTGRHLVGYLAKGDSAGTSFSVIRTTINVLKGGAAAVNGTVVTQGENLAPDSVIVRTARSVSCGSGGTALEPQS